VAEARKRSLPIQIYSGGVYDFSDQPALTETSDTCLANHTPPAKETPTWVGQLPLDSIDRFLVMEHSHADILTREYGVAPERISLLGAFDPHGRGVEIADPFGHGPQTYDRSYQLIRDCVCGYLETTGELK
jgi:protein-tyrosine-phosphatase